MVEFLFLGDLHIERERRLFPKSSDIYNSTRQVINQAVEYARQNGGLPIIQPGDVFDSFAPEQKSIDFILQEIANSKLDWFFNMGNHDTYYSNKNNSATESGEERHSLQAMNAVSKNFNVSFKTFVEPTLTKLDNQPFIFLPWPYRTHRLIKENEKCFVVSHIEYNGTKADSGRIFDIEGGKFKPRSHFFGIGHLHEYQTGNSYLYCGSPLQLNFGESSNKYFVHFKISKNFRVRYKRIPIIPPYILRNFIIDSETKLTKALKELDKNSILWGKFWFKNNQDFGFNGHEKVLNRKPFSDKADIERIVTEEFALDTIQAFNFDRFKLLKDRLSKQQIPKKEIKTTLKLAKMLEQKVTKL